LKDLAKHIERMMKPYREIEKMTEPIRRMQKQLSASTLAMQKVLEPTLQFQKSLNQPLLNFQKSFEHINKIYLSIPKFENPILKHLDTFKEIGERLKEYAEKTPEYFLLIAKHGWFIDLESELNLPARVANEIQNNELETANGLLVEYYKKNLDQIFKSLINRHPNRKGILTQILSAYKNGNHSLLIPSVLTQVDGICFDFSKKKFFIKEKSIKKYKYLPEVIVELEKSQEIFWNYIFHLLKIRHQ